MADRVYLPDARERGPILVVEGDEAHHLGRVRRVVVGEMVEVFDGRGFGSLAEVVKVDKRSVELRMVGDPLPDRQPALRLTVASALPRGERVDWMVEKLSELGVERLVPLVTSRTVVDPRPAKLERLRRTAVEAAKQCGRNTLLEISETFSWDRLRNAPTNPTACWFIRVGNHLRHGRDPDSVPRGSWRSVPRGVSATRRSRRGRPRAGRSSAWVRPSCGSRQPR